MAVNDSLLSEIREFLGGKIAKEFDLVMAEFQPQIEERLRGVRNKVVSEAALSIDKHVSVTHLGQEIVIRIQKDV